jgi:hypothetical protein
MIGNPHPRFAAVLLAAIASGQVVVQYAEPEAVRTDPPLMPEFERLKVAPRASDRDKPWRRWPVRR